MLGVWIFTVIFSIAIFGGFLKGIRRIYQKPDRSGWLYFAAGARTPVLVSTSREKPDQGSLPPYPQPLRILHKVQVTDTVAASRHVYMNIGEYEKQSGWFDRDAALFYLDHIKEA